MPTPVLQRIEAWSFSRWKDHTKCPRLAKYKHIDKKKEPGNDAMARGQKIDGDIEKYLKGLLPLPAEAVSFKKEFVALKKLKPQTQENWAFGRKWNYLGEDGWFSKQAWLRVKMDAAVLVKKAARVIDFKTGKQYEDHKLQLELYALSAFIIFPSAEVAETNLWYIDLGKEDPVKFYREQLPELQAKWGDRTKVMLADIRFPAKPGNHCTHCHFRKSNGGPCEF